MTQEQRITRGTITIFILSIVLFACLCLTATLAYFAGSQDTKTTLILGGPVRVTMYNGSYENTSGEGNLVMSINGDRGELLPGIGIDMQAIAHLTSSNINPTKALLRAILDIDVTGLTPAQSKAVEMQIREEMGRCLTERVDGERDGWVLFDDGKYYYCSKDKEEDPDTHQEYISVLPINTGGDGTNITFINGIFQFPYKYYTNTYSNIAITFTLRFQAIQEVLVNDSGERIPNNIFNVQHVLDGVDWEKHNN